MVTTQPPGVTDRGTVTGTVTAGDIYLYQIPVVYIRAFSLFPPVKKKPKNKLLLIPAEVTRALLRARRWTA
jgi:hypothetical protein